MKTKGFCVESLKKCISIYLTRLFQFAKRIQKLLSAAFRLSLFTHRFIWSVVDGHLVTVSHIHSLSALF